MQSKFDITNQKFGKLTAIKFVGRDKHHKALWLCNCECGNTAVCSLGNLRKGNSKSCGCVNRENLLKVHTTHNKSNTRLYSIWSNMKNRCADKKKKNYGGRGIRVCDEWKNDFTAFYNWAINNGYADDLTLDRIDNNGNYEPTNCRWATIEQQSRNKRTNHFIFVNGENYTITDLAIKLNCSRHTIARRIENGEKIEI